MSLTLVQAALDLSRPGPRRAALIAAPILLWSSPRAADPDEAWARTATSDSAPPRPADGESLVYPVVKSTLHANAFALGITLGRVESNDLCLGDPTVSRFHAWFARDPKSGSWFLTDADSDNGTRVAGERIKSGAKQKLGDDVVLHFGAVEVRFFEPAAFARFVDGGGS